jgi:site-specific DNA recombinase
MTRSWLLSGPARLTGIVFYSTSRLTRPPREFEDIIQVVEDTGVRLASCTAGQVDLTTADGRMMARWMAAGDAAESERIGERVSRAFVQRREAGKPHATELHPFGFRGQRRLRAASCSGSAAQSGP